MEFKEFIDRLEQNLKVALEDGPGNAKVEVRPVEKMQGESYTAITITPNDGNLGMNLNADALYKLMEDGASYQSVVARALSQATSFLEDSHSFDVNSITDYANAKPKLFVEVVGAERNEEMLAKVPHKQIEDMAMVYRIQVESKEDGLASVLVTNALLNTMGISADKLHEDAMANSEMMRPAKIQKMAEVIAEMTGMPVEMVEASAPPIYVISSEDKVKGAASIFYPDMMDTIGKEVGSDFYVLPSSIHEVLVLPDNGDMTVEELKEMVTSINGDVVDPADVLTDQVYHYDTKERLFEVGEKFEARQAEKEAAKNGRFSVLQDLKEKQKDIAEIPKVAGARAANGLEL